MAASSLWRATRELSDDELLRRSGTDADAFGEFYRRHCSAVLKYFSGCTDSPETAAELTAETFAQAWSSRKSFRVEGSAGGWLFGIARHLLHRWYRRQRIDARARRRLGMRWSVDLDDASTERIEELAATERARRRVHEAMASLSPPVRDAVRLRICDQLPYEAIADQLLCSLGAARARVARGLAQIDKSMETEQLG